MTLNSKHCAKNGNDLSIRHQHLYLLSEWLAATRSTRFLKKTLDEQGGFLSVISKIELLGWQTGSSEQLQNVADFVQDSEVLPLTDAIVDKTIEIRRSQKIKLPDAVIAATAIVCEYTLISRNDEDFRKIPGLNYLNPFTDI